MRRRTIINSGLSCFVRAKSTLMKEWLDDESTHDRVLEWVRRTALHRTRKEDLTFPGLGPCLPGFSMSVQVLDDQLLEAVFDEMIGEQCEKEIRERLPWSHQVCLEPIFILDQKQVHVDCTGFLVYAVVKNSRCLKELRDYLETERDLCHEAYLASSYVDTPFLQWFPVQLQTDARLCLGLLQRIRQGDEPAYHAYMKIACNGYKKMKNELKRCKAVDGEALRGLSEEEDMGYRLSILVLALAMAQDMGVPVKEDYTFYSILSMLIHYEEKMFTSVEEVEITDLGIACQEKLEQQYNCNDFHRCYVESVYQNPPKETVPEQLGLIYKADYDRIFSTFHLNPRVLHGIRLSREEIQKLCSSEEEWEWEDYEPVLLMGTLCKYISRISRTEQETESLKLREKVKDLERELQESRKMLLGMKERLSKTNAEKEKSDREASDFREAVRRKKEQIATMGKQREADRKELEDLRKFVSMFSEKPEGFTVDPIAAPSDKKLQKEIARSLEQAFGGREVVVIGGHENWQRRVREQFPKWQYLSADKNNFDVRMIQNKSVIIVNTLILKHSCYYRIMAQRRPEQRVLYVNENNMERFLEELERQICE